MPIRSLIVDDNRSFLEAARVLLEREDLTVADVATTSDEALRKAETLRPDVVLVDVSLGEESGLNLARRLVDADPGNEVVVVLISTLAETDIVDLIAEARQRVFWRRRTCRRARFAGSSTVACVDRVLPGVEEGDHRENAALIVLCRR
jgi:CheY-like chemotaxis protein